MIGGDELWDGIFKTLSQDSALMALIDDVYDKVPSAPWRARKAYLSRGPFYGVPNDADCISSDEITAQIDAWSRKTARGATDVIVTAMRRALHGRSLVLPSGANVSLWVTLWRIIDDPDPLTTHGIVQVTAIIEQAEV
jgi:hypothetical protein